MMLLSFITAITLSLVYDQSWWLIIVLAILHMIFIMADSSTLTAGLVLSAPNEVKGAAMGLHSLVGFIGGLVGPALFGYVLDLTQKVQLQNPWSYAYASIVIFSFAYVIVNWKIMRVNGINAH